MMPTSAGDPLDSSSRSCISDFTPGRCPAKAGLQQQRPAAGVEAVGAPSEARIGVAALAINLDR
jgi:hypothetical protein